MYSVMYNISSAPYIYLYHISHLILVHHNIMYVHGCSVNYISSTCTHVYIYTTNCLIQAFCQVGDDGRSSHFPHIHITKINGKNLEGGIPQGPPL